MKAKKLIKKKLEELKDASNVTFQPKEYYDRIDAKIMILEDIISELESKPITPQQCEDRMCKNNAVRKYKGIFVCGGHYAQIKHFL